jgi:type IV pilus assembly protein PilY1
MKKQMIFAALAVMSASSFAQVPPPEAGPLNIAQTPLFIRQPEPPLNMLVLGRDHKLFYEAYNDASDLNGDGIVDVGYKPTTVTYYGLFDSFKCYTYDTGNGRFVPTSTTSNKKCSGAWSGDFLNYVTSSRYDALKRVMFGGTRVVDGTTTVLERTLVPQDGHSWAKEFRSEAVDGYKISEYTPLAEPTQANVGHLFGSVNLGSVDPTPAAPLLRVLPNSRFRPWNWASTEGPVLATGNCTNIFNNTVGCTRGSAGFVRENPPNSFYSNMTLTTFRRARTGTTTAVVTNTAEFDALMAAEATLANRCNSGGATQISLNNNPYRNQNGCPDDNLWFIARYTGNIVAPQGGWNYNMRLNSSAYAARIFIDGTLVASAFNAAVDFDLNLAEGTHPMVVEYEYRGTGTRSLSLQVNFGNFPASAMTDYTVRVEACKAGLLEDNCRAYPKGAATPTSYKPAGILHEYGEDDVMMFGLLTGTYRNNQEGGVIRKVVSSFKNEVDPATGSFTNYNGIVSAMNKIRLVGFVSNSHTGAAAGRCPGLSRLINPDECYSWGNPLAEMMYESLNYFGGVETPTASFTTTTGRTVNFDSILGLPEETRGAGTNPFRDPATGGFSVCAQPFQTIISDINPSYDTDFLPAITNLGNRTDLNVVSRGTTIWNNEGLGSRNIYIGEVGALNDGAPTPKTANSFGNIRGLSPEEPTKKGGFYSASLAHFAYVNDINSAGSGQKVRTFSIALASPLPRIELPVGGRTVSMIPFAKTISGTFGGAVNLPPAAPTFKPTNTIVDFYVQELVNFPGVRQDAAVNGGRPFAQFRINYEDVEQGNDHDMDAIVEYQIGLQADGTLRVALSSEYAAGSANQNMGYIISGTNSTQDGIYLEVRDVDNTNRAQSAYRLNTPNVRAGQCTQNSGLATTLIQNQCNVTPLPDICNCGLGFKSERFFTLDASGGQAATVLRDPLWYAAKYGGFDDKNNNQLPDQQIEWDAKGPPGPNIAIPDGNPDNYFLVTNALTLKAQLDEAFRVVLQISRPQGRLSTNSTRISGRTLLYQAEYDSRDWSGDVRAFNFNPSTLQPTTQAWSANDKLPAPASRNIVTFNPEIGASGAGVTFDLGNLTTAQKNQLHPSDDTERTKIINYLRGDQTNERNNGGVYRDRTRLIGDIANSNPVVSSRDNFGYPDTDYQAFLDTKAARGDFVFVGANDGMLHAFNGAANGAGGTEVFGYIPNAVFANLKELTNANFGNPKFAYVDSTPTLGDAKIGGQWRSILLGATGAGGRAIFALDVTNPAAFGPTNVLWEFTDGDLGYTIGQPKIIRMPNGEFAAIFGNGYNGVLNPSNTHKSMLYVVRLSDGALLAKFDSGAGTATDTNGMGSPVGLDASGLDKARLTSARAVPYAALPGLSTSGFDGRTDTIFVGDLLGNLWKIDAQSSDVSTWSMGLLFQARSPANVGQRITAAPQGVAHPFGGVLVVFGTGRYFVKSDGETRATDPINSFYGVWDTGNYALSRTLPAVDRSSMIPRTITGTTTGVANVGTVRNIAGDPINWRIHNGYYLDFGANALIGEKILAQPLVRFGRVFFNTFAPNVNLNDSCEPGGRGFLMVLDALSGIPKLTLPDGTPCNSCGGAERSTESPPGEPALLTGDGVLVDPDPNFANSTNPQNRVLGRPYGQQSWRQMR